MRTIASVLFSAVLLGCSQSNNKLSSQLLNRHWYVKSQFWERDKTATFTTDSAGKYDWEAKFLPGGKMFYASTYSADFYDSKGVKHFKGEHFTDTLYRYDVKNNILKVTKGNEIYFLKFAPKSANEFVISPAEENEYK